MDKSCLVHLLHGCYGRIENILRLLPGHRSLFFERGKEGFALDVIHDDVGGAVFVEAFPDAHHLRNILHLHHLLSLPEEGLHAGFAEALTLGVLRPLQEGGGGGVAAGVALGVELLDGNLPLQVQVIPYVGDAEAALAKHFSYHIVAVEHCAQGEHIAGCRGHPGVKAAVGTGVALNLLHTAQTTVKLHTIRLFSSRFVNRITE